MPKAGSTKPKPQRVKGLDPKLLTDDIRAMFERQHDISVVPWHELMVAGAITVPEALKCRRVSFVSPDAPYDLQEAIFLKTKEKRVDGKEVLQLGKLARYVATRTGVIARVVSITGSTKYRIDHKSSLTLLHPNVFTALAQVYANRVMLP